MTDMSLPPRHLDWPACLNARDLGGYPTSDGCFIRWRALVRSDNLCRLTPEGQAALMAYGVQTIIDLRSTYELVIDPSPFASPLPQPVEYLNLPFIDEKDRALSAAIDAAASTYDAYRLMLRGCRSQIAAVVRRVAFAKPGTVLFHCHAGQDRTGLIAALQLSLAGVSAEIVAADYANTRQKPISASIMLETLAWIEKQYGSVEAYSAGCGLQAQDIAALRVRLRDDGQAR